jgi:DNA/RNA-binding domain of Phe-tRNA-synthetase-like protein
MGGSSLVMLSFSLDKSIIERFSEIEVHAVCVHGLRSAMGKLNDETLLQKAVTSLQKEGIDGEKLSDFPTIAAWREAYAKMHVKPSRFRSSIEALLRRALKGNSLLLPIPIVNFYNALSIMNLAPAGAYDASKLPSNTLEMRLARPDTDSFEPLGAEPADFPLNNDLAVYATGNTILCWGFNCRDSKAVALDNQTDDAIFFSEVTSKSQASRSYKLIDAIRIRLLDIGVSCSEHVIANAESLSFEV